MPRGVDDRTQVLWVTLKTEAQLLKSWMARREDVAQRRREGPLEALRYRLQLLEREVPRLGVEVAALEKELQRRGQHRAPVAFAGGVVRGALLIAAAVLWVVGVVTLTPNARLDDPLRLAAMLSIIALVALGRVAQEKRS